MSYRTFVTEDGVYEDDTAAKRIRLRRRGWAGPWMRYAAISPVRVGGPVTIFKRPEGSGDVGAAARTKPVIAA